MGVNVQYIKLTAYSKMIQWTVFLIMLSMFSCQATTLMDTTTTDWWIWTDWDPCLPDDGSAVPDCSKYIDPDLKQPAYLEHAYNCSRYWECGPGGETCLFECAPCGIDNPMCNGQWALSFDVRYQYPLGPVCDWPSTINCTNGGCEDKEPRPECCSDEECNNGCPASHCSHNFQCIYDEHCDCTLDTDCDTYDGICNIPPPHTNDTCAYCSDGQCKGGCLLDSNCIYPAPVCDVVDHTCKCRDDNDRNSGDFCNNAGLCEQGMCNDHPECSGYDQICDIANYNNCFFCDGGNGCSSEDGCCEGCHDSGLNCEYPAPICDLADHTCKCNDDSDCHPEDFCNASGICEIAVCLADTECNGFDQICNAQYDNCFYCGKDDCPSNADGCCPGCHDSALNCEYPAPVCDQASHTCKCSEDSDCHAEDFCNNDGIC